jgi:hypothetical protein
MVGTGFEPVPPACRATPPVALDNERRRTGAAPDGLLPLLGPLPLVSRPLVARLELVVHVAHDLVTRAAARLSAPSADHVSLATLRPRHILVSAYAAHESHGTFPCSLNATDVTRQDRRLQSPTACRSRPFLIANRFLIAESPGEIVGPLARVLHPRGDRRPVRGEAFGPRVARDGRRRWRAGNLKTRRFQRVHGMGGTGLEPVTPSLSSWCSPN